MSRIRVALANLRYPATPEESVRLATAAIAETGALGAQIVCFPECYVPGYRDATRHRPAADAQFLETAWDAVARAARGAGVAVVLGTERFVDGDLRLTALILDRDGTVLGFQDKVQLDPSEERAYVPGRDRSVFTTAGVTFGVVICHEGWRYPETVRWAARRGAQIVFHPHFHEPTPGSFRPTEFGDPRNSFHEGAALCRAAENTCWFVTVNCAVEGSPTTSAVIAPDGTVAAWQPYGGEGVLVAEVELDRATGFLAGRLRTSV